jgi:hypothetical protein
VPLPFASKVGPKPHCSLKEGTGIDRRGFAKLLRAVLTVVVLSIVCMSSAQSLAASDLGVRLVLAFGVAETPLQNEQTNEANYRALLVRRFGQVRVLSNHREEIV